MRPVSDALHMNRSFVGFQKQIILDAFQVFALVFQPKSSTQYPAEQDQSNSGWDLHWLNPPGAVGLDNVGRLSMAESIRDGCVAGPVNVCNDGRRGQNLRNGGATIKRLIVVHDAIIRSFGDSWRIGHKLKFDAVQSDNESG